jgi:hypothetical protein
VIARSLLLALLLAAPVAAQCAEATVAAPAPPKKAASVDYTALREQAAAKPDFSGYESSTNDQAAIDALRAGWGNDKRKALEHFLVYLEANPHSLAANRFAAEAFEALAQMQAGSQDQKWASELAPRYRADYKGLIDSVLASGDGRTCATAWRVISITEEYEVLYYLRLAKPGQALSTADGRVCDHFTGTDEAGVEKQVYFDISRFFGKF